jgi:hypothetical protein
VGREKKEWWTMNLGKGAAILAMNLPRINAARKEIKKLLGTGSINFQFKIKKELTLDVIIDNPTADLEKLAEEVLLILPTLYLPGILVNIDIRKSGETKLLKAYRQGWQ